jgi:hypothetical protein
MKIMQIPQINTILKIMHLFMGLSIKNHSTKGIGKKGISLSTKMEFIHTKMRKMSITVSS